MKLKSLFVTALAVLMLTSFVGCTEESPISKKPVKKSIKIEDIDWQVNPAVREGERFLSLDYTNNTKFTIIGLDIKFTQKDGLTEEQLHALDDYVEEEELDEDEIKDVYILGYNHKCADPGETVTESPCVLDGGYDLATAKQYEIMQPDMAEIYYVGDDGLGYITYYDFINDTYSTSPNGKTLIEWSDSEVAKQIPKPDDAVIISLGWETDSSLSFDAFGMSYDEYKSYVKSVKEAGFSIDVIEDEDSFNADNENGYGVTIYYSDLEEETDVYLLKN